VRTRILAAISVIVFVLLGVAGQAFANTAIEGQRLDYNAPYYWPDLDCTSGGNAIPLGSLPKLIPEPYNGAFTQGGNNNKVAPALVAAIFTEENFTHTPTSQLAQTWTNFLKSHPNPNGGWPTSPAGATGPFQFLPSTWTGLGYNISDIDKLSTAADAAAKYLGSNGATVDKPPSSWQNAIFQYNHAQWYVDAVMLYYNFYNNGTSSTSPAGATTANLPCGGGATTVNCKGATPAGTQGLSQTRQNVVCVAENQLAIWTSKPGYPHPAYSESGYRTDPTNYTQGRSEEWCADFATWVYNQAGDPIQKPDWNIAYVPNIQAAGQSGGANHQFHWHPIGSGYTPRPGDFAIHGANHVNIFIDNKGPGGTNRYIGGDQGSGPYPGGSIVSWEYGRGYWDNGITGYVSPD
jgi:hypothetical protein